MPAKIGGARNEMSSFFFLGLLKSLEILTKKNMGWIEEEKKRLLLSYIHNWSWEVLMQKNGVNKI